MFTNYVDKKWELKLSKNFDILYGRKRHRRGGGVGGQKRPKTWQRSLWTPPKYTKFRSAWKISLEVRAHESLMTLFWWKIFLWGESFFFARYFIMGPEERDLWEKYIICENYYWLSIEFHTNCRQNTMLGKCEQNNYPFQWHIFYCEP